MNTFSYIKFWFAKELVEFIFAIIILVIVILVLLISHNKRRQL